MGCRSLTLYGFIGFAVMAANPAMSQVQSICTPDSPPAPVMPIAPIDQAPPPVSVPPVDTTVRDIDRDEKGFPKWSNFPAAPQNVPTASDIKQRVTDVKSQEAALEQAVASLAWDQIDPVAYSATVRNRLDSQLSRPVTKNSCAEIQQFALTNRAKAVPPPSADR